MFENLNGFDGFFALCCICQLNMASILFRHFSRSKSCCCNDVSLYFFLPLSNEHKLFARSSFVVHYAFFFIINVIRRFFPLK